MNMDFSFTLPGRSVTRGDERIGAPMEKDSMVIG